MPFLSLEVTTIFSLMFNSNGCKRRVEVDQIQKSCVCLLLKVFGLQNSGGGKSEL
jgi:hypothetical protein